MINELSIINRVVLNKKAVARVKGYKYCGLFGLDAALNDSLFLFRSNKVSEDFYDKLIPCFFAIWI